MPYQNGFIVLHGYPSLQYIDSSVDVSIVMRLTPLARPVPIGEL